MEVSIFKTFGDYKGNESLEDVLERIKNGFYATVINALRKYVEEGNEKRIKAMKNGLEGFTFSAVFNEVRKEEFIEFCNGAIMLDIDGLGVDNVERFMQCAAAIPYTLFCFRSPSGNGLKIGVLPRTRIVHSVETHKRLFALVAAYYESRLGVKIDRSGSDIGRLCYMSYDPYTYYNPELCLDGLDFLEDITVKSVPARSKKAEKTGKTNGFTVFGKALKTVAASIGEYREGNRNITVYRVSLICLEKGVLADELGEMLEMHFKDLQKEEISKTMLSAVKHLEEKAVEKGEKISNSVKKNHRFCGRLRCKYISQKRQSQIFYRYFLRFFVMSGKSLIYITEKQRVERQNTAPPLSVKVTFQGSQGREGC